MRVPKELLPLSVLEQRQHDHQSLPLGTEQEITDAFHRLSYDAARKGLTWHAAAFHGYPVYKWAADLWLYVELFWDVKPRTVIETGTAGGGSALLFAKLMEWERKAGTVITVDIQPLNRNWPAHDRIFYVPGFDSREWPPKRGQVIGGQVVTIPPYLEPPVLVVLDSDHSKDHVLKELDVYGPLVTPGSYMVVEDSNVNGHPVLHEHGPGPAEALEEWLPLHPEFKPDLARAQAHLFSYHSWLKKVDVQRA